MNTEKGDQCATPSPDATQDPDQFNVAASPSLIERRLRALKQGDTFGVFGQSGDISRREGSPEGLYYRDTRYLSHLSLSIEGMRPLLLSSTLRDDNATLTCDLANPDLRSGDRLLAAHNLIHIRRSKFLWNAVCYERIALRSFGDTAYRLRLTLQFAADFADVFEVRGLHRQRRGSLAAPAIGQDAVSLVYTGLDGVRRETRLRFNPRPVSLDGALAAFDIDLPPRGGAVIFFEAGFSGAPPEREPRRAFLASLRDGRRWLRAAALRGAAVATSNDIFNEVVRRAVSDLHMLITDCKEGPFPYAGIPWYSTVFGRDALITALHTLWLDPTIARGVLGYLAANQAQHRDPSRDAEPGKILHEMRQGEVAALGEVPFDRYYGSVDATPLFVMLAGAYLQRTGDLAFIRCHWPAIEAALRWIDGDGDPDRDGFVEYGGTVHSGLLNQGWKDSADSIFHADGALARGPIALVEVQAYVYAAKQAAAEIAWKLGFGERAAALEDEAETLRRRFDEAFWDDELGGYALALDGDKRPCRVRNSNAGHSLFTGIALPHRAEPLIRLLMSGPLFSGWGIRTIGLSEARYNPMSYHNGSVWPHDNALIAMGFARYGLGREAGRVFAALFDASIYMDLRRLPELFCGFVRRRGHGPTAYPVACSPQAWASTAPLSLLRTCLGLGFDPTTRSVVFDRPVLPDFLDEVVLRRLSLGDAEVDVALTRLGSEVAVNVLARRGDIRVMTIN